MDNIEGCVAVPYRCRAREKLEQITNTQCTPKSSGLRLVKVTTPSVACKITHVVYMFYDDDSFHKVINKIYNIKNLRRLTLVIDSSCSELFNYSFKENISVSTYNIDVLPTPRNGWEPFFKANDKILKNVYAAIEADTKVAIFPPLNLVFNAFQQCCLSQVKVVIIGQDCYPKKGQAMGLSFSVPDGVPIPSSLQNIFKELVSDGFRSSTSGDLTKWAQRGVLLINTALTVIEDAKESHLRLWKDFTANVIRHISEKTDHTVFILWGQHARNYKNIIDCDKHGIVESAHPSGLSAHRGFFGSKPFSKANSYLTKFGKEPVDWNLS